MWDFREGRTLKNPYHEGGVGDYGGLGHLFKMDISRKWHFDWWILFIVMTAALCCPYVRVSVRPNYIYFRIEGWGRQVVIKANLKKIWQAGHIGGGGGFNKYLFEEYFI